MTNIFDLAAEIARLRRADDTDDTSGYIGHEGDPPNVGWYSGGGTGHSIFAIHPDDIVPLMERLAPLPDRAFEHGPVLRKRPEFAGLRVEFHV